MLIIVLNKLFLGMMWQKVQVFRGQKARSQRALSIAGSKVTFKAEDVGTSYSVT